MTKVQVYLLVACVFAAPHLYPGVAVVLSCVAGFLAWRAMRHGD
jgi:hypothetical protein